MTTRTTIFSQNLLRQFVLLVIPLVMLLLSPASTKAQCTLVCNGNVQISMQYLAGGCRDTLTPDMFLQQPYCTGAMSVTALDLNTNTLLPTVTNPDGSVSAVITSAQIGHTLRVTTKHLASGNSCWSNAKVEDKLAPVVTNCSDVTLSCSKSLASLPTSANPIADDCSTVTASKVDVRTDLDCNFGGYSYKVVRTWSFTDAYGNVSSCTQTIWFSRDTFSGVESATNGFPLDIVLACESNFPTVPSTDGYRHPRPDGVGGAGVPTINGGSLYPNALGFCEINSAFSDQIIPVCAPSSYKILRTWTIADWCTGQVYTDIQIIKISDNNPPTITFCPPSDVTWEADYNNCWGNPTLPRPTAVTNCNSPFNVSVTSQVAEIFGHDAANLNVKSNITPTEDVILKRLPVGTVDTITWTFENGCNGLKTVCKYAVKIIDKVAPIPVCRQVTKVSLGTDGSATIDALSFNEGSHDNCGVVEYKVRRLPSPCVPAANQVFADFVTLTCCDIKDTVMVELRIKDAAGNTNSCMVQVLTEDKLAPSITCPPSVTVECGTYELASASLTNAYLAQNFGKVVSTQASRQNILVNIAGDGTNTPVNIGKDGFATDNCAPLTIAASFSSTINSCGVGSIVRTFSVTDRGGRSAVCTQTISVVNLRPFNGTTAIQWPTDITVSTCGAATDPDSLAVGSQRPIFTETSCDLVATAYEDLELPIQLPACKKILRKWTVIDWCQYDPNVTGSTGFYTYTQVIKVLNTIAPNFTTSCRDTAICQYPNTCASSSITLSVTATDDCTPNNRIKYSWKADAGDNGTTDFTGNGNSLSQALPFGTNRITWSAEDGCGNVRTCSYKVQIKDCKKPTPICINGLTIDLMPATGMVPINATAFDGGSYDNCGAIAERKLTHNTVTPGTLAPPASASDTLIFTCDNLGTNILALWVRDSNGNWDYCETYIIVQNNMGAPCPGSGSANIAGLVKDETAHEVEQTTVKATYSSNAFPYITGASNPLFQNATPGFFGYNIPNGVNVTVTPEKDMNPLNGVSTFDLVLMSRHILGITPLESPYKIIAADINRSGTVTTFDMVELRKLILRITDNFTNNSSWRFVDAAYQFPNPLNPFENAFPEVKSFTSISGSKQADFVAVKIGDVNGSAVANNLLGSTESRSNATTTFLSDDVNFKAGELVTMNVTTAEFATLQGYQFTMNFDNSKLAFVDIRSENAKTDNFGLTMLNEGILTASFDGKTATENVFTVVFKAKASGILSNFVQLNSRLTAAEAYTTAGDLQDLSLQFRGNNNAAANGGFELYQNQPNPFRATTMIGFNLPESASAKLTIFDVSGRVLKVIENTFAKGFNQVGINRNEIAPIGGNILYYQLETSTATATKKMIIIE